MCNVFHNGFCFMLNLSFPTPTPFTQMIFSHMRLSDFLSDRHMSVSSVVSLVLLQTISKWQVRNSCHYKCGSIQLCTCDLFVSVHLHLHSWLTKKFPCVGGQEGRNFWENSFITCTLNDTLVLLLLLDHASVSLSICLHLSLCLSFSTSHLGHKACLPWLLLLFCAISVWSDNSSVMIKGWKWKDV